MSHGNTDFRALAPISMGISQDNILYVAAVNQGFIRLYSYKLD